MADLQERGTFLAPAKVNLALLVGPARDDGYHELCTVFAPVDLYDELAYDLSVASEGPPGALDVRCPGVDCQTNLVTKAVRRLEAKTGWTVSGVIGIRKKIPLAAGMGGGSSNAARALLLASGLVERAGGPALDRPALEVIAAELGADVPFFLEPRPCLAKGVGEQMRPLELPPIPLVVVFPEASLSTAEVYQTFDGVAPPEDEAAFRIRCRRADEAWTSLAAAWSSGELTAEDVCSRAAGLLYNDLEPAAFHLLPDLPDLKAVLEDRGLAALVSGSGPTVFGVAPSAEEAAAVVRSLDRDGIEARCVVAGPLV